MTSCSFKDFTREWGGLLVQDTAASLDHFLVRYRSADAMEGQAATIEDYTDLWTAAKRANMEWEATCMVRSIRQSVAMDGPVTVFHLMTAMTCWAATLHQRVPDFFKECKSQVHDVVAHVVARCTAWAGEDGASVLYHEITFCVALELFGWHDSFLTCLRLVSVQHQQRQDDPVKEQEVLLFISTVGQYLTPKYLPRGFSTESTPNLTTGRTSALSSSSERDATLSHHHHMRYEGAVVHDDPPSPPQRYVSSEDPTSLRVKLEHTRAVGTARKVGPDAATDTTTASPPPASPAGSRIGPTVPLQAPRSPGTPQPSPKNFASGPPPPPPPCRSHSTTTATAAASSAALEKSQKDEIRGHRRSIPSKKRKMSSKKDAQGCAPF